MGRLLARNFSGASIKFDGSATKITSNNVLDFTSSGSNSKLTMMVWHYCPESVSPSRRFFGGATGQFYCGRNSNNLYFAGVLGTGTNASVKISVGKWSFFAVTISGSEYRYYVNGVLVSVNTQANTPSAASAMIVGADSTGNYANDYIADPAIFNRVLTAEEIRAAYEIGPDAYPKDGSCVLDYRFKEGAVGGIADEIIDNSGKGNHGQLTMGSGRIDPYNIPVPNRVIIAPNMPLVGLRSDGSNGIDISDANIAAAFGVAAGQVGVNGISGGAWIKKQRHVSNYQTVVAKGVYGASGWGGVIDLQTSIHTLIPISYGSSSASVSNNNKNYNNHSHAAWVNGLTYGKCFHAGIKTKHENKTLTGNGTSAFSLISSASGNITLASMFFLANRALTDSEVYNIYSKSIFPPDVLFWHGPDETGTKIACYRGSYSPTNRVPDCDCTLPAGITFTDDVPWR